MRLVTLRAGLATHPLDIPTRWYGQRSATKPHVVVHLDCGATPCCGALG